MRRVISPIFLMLAALGLLAACAYNEQLGRSQLLITGEGAMAQAAASSWQQIKTQGSVSQDPRYTSRLNRVAPRILRAAGEDPSRWEYIVFEDDSLNAFALPGNRFAIHTGIMDIMENDAQLATVVGHEVAHVLYRHSGERYSQNVLASVGLVGATVALGSNCGGTTAERRNCEQRSSAAVQALGLGALYGAILPFSRKHELEADTGGVRYMAQAGYDVCESVDFWQKMASASAGQARPPEFASTHPASGTRISNLRQVVAGIGRNCA